MSKFIKKIKRSIIFLSLTFAMFSCLMISKTFAITNNTYTREELQQMIVSAALSYYYNNVYADYEQYPLDYDVKYPASTVECNTKGKECKSNSYNYPLVASTFFRNISITPEEVSTSNRFSTDCTGFTYLVYNNVLGYDLSEFYKLAGSNTYTTFNTSTGKPQKKVLNASIDNFNEAVQNHARVWNSSGNLTRIANCIAAANANKKDRNVCKFDAVEDDALKETLSKYDKDGTEANKGGSYVNNNSEIVYNYHFCYNTKDEKYDYDNCKYAEEWKEINPYFNKDDKKFLLQPGDMLKITYKENGHVLIYVGDAINSDDKGFIHSTGSDNSWDEIGIRYDSDIYSYLNEKIQKSISSTRDGDKLVDLSIFRPLNYYCTGNECTNEKITDNDKARVAFSATRVSSYIKKGAKDLTSHSSVDKGDTIIYGLNLTDKRNFGYCTISYLTDQTKCEEESGKWKKAGNIYDNNAEESFYVKFTAPDGTKISAVEYFNGSTKCKNCTDKCEGATTCEGKVNRGATAPRFTLTIDSDKLSELKPAKFEITYKQNTLTLKSVSLKVNRTINSNDVEKLSNTIEDFKSKNNNKTYTYSEADKISSTTKINSTTEFSSLDFIKYVYYKNFNIDLRKLSGQEIVKSLFYEWTGGTTDYPISAFLKKAAGTGDISKMLVDQVYGGRKLIGNENGKRIKYIHMGDFEVGDIIVFSNTIKIDNYTHDRAGNAVNYSLTNIDYSKDFKYYLVTGFDGTGYPILVSFNSNGVDYCTKAVKKFTDNYILNDGKERKCSSTTIKHLLYSSTLFAVLRPTQVYNDVTYKVTAYDDTEKLGTYDVKYNDVYKDKISPTKDGYKFVDLYFDKDYTKIATTVNLHTNHDLYVKFSLNEYTITFNSNNGAGTMSAQKVLHNTATKLSKNTFTRVGYTFAGWNTKADGTGTSYTNEQSVSLSNNVTLYAQWTINKYKITFNSNGGIGTMLPQEFLFNASSKLNKNTFVRDGFKFIGWNTKADGTGISYTDEQGISISCDLILYAQWNDKDPFVINKYSYNEDNNFVGNIDVNTTIDKYIQNIELASGYTVKVDSKTIDNKQVLYTGGKTRVYKNQVLYAELVNVVSGDTNGDGKINYLDYVNVYNHIQKTKHSEINKKLLVDEYLSAADMSKDNKISYLDYVKIYNKIKELKGGSN